MTWLLITVFCSSCCTSILWELTDPNDRVEVSFRDATEQEWKAEGLDYYRDETQKLFYVEQNSNQKFENYTLRTVGTPITVAVDAVILLMLSQEDLIIPLE
jgi:hypothetical protein